MAKRGQCGRPGAACTHLAPASIASPPGPHDAPLCEQTFDVRFNGARTTRSLGNISSQRTRSRTVTSRKPAFTGLRRRRFAPPDTLPVRVQRLHARRGRRFRPLRRARGTAAHRRDINPVTVPSVRPDEPCLQRLANFADQMHLRGLRATGFRQFQVDAYPIPCHGRRHGFHPPGRCLRRAAMAGNCAQGKRRSLGMRAFCPIDGPFNHDVQLVFAG